MKKNVLFREALREIRHSKNRFFSILAIVAIGSGFFSGVKAACPDMKLTAEQYFTESSLADLHLVSTWGFDEDDLAQIGSDQDIRVMEPCYTLERVYLEVAARQTVTSWSSRQLVTARTHSSTGRGCMKGDCRNRRTSV